MQLFQENKELKIGKILEVNGTSITVELDIALTELSKIINGKVYYLGQIGSIIKIHYGRKILFAYVRMLRMKPIIELDDNQRVTSNNNDIRILEADLFAQGIWSNDKLEYSRGVEIYPLPLQNVYIILEDELENLYLGAESAHENNLIEIGYYTGSNGAKCRANIDKMFGQHCAVLGSTGSGKSGTVASIIHAINDTTLKPRIILIDPHNEYGRSFKNHATVYRAYTDPNTSSTSEKLILPYWLMSGDELRALIIGKTEAEATTQNNIVYKALKHARMVTIGIVSKLPEEPTGGFEPELMAGKTVDDVIKFDRDKPIKFDLSEFVKHIDKVQGRKNGEIKPLSATDRKSIDSILDKLNVLVHDPRLGFLMESGTMELPQLIFQLTGYKKNTVEQDANGKESKKYIKIIDVSGLPNEVAGPLTALIARLLFNYKLWQSREEREKDPILLVCEEAHRYVPNHGEAQYKEAQEAIKRIAKEGRKYGIGLMLVSQRPSDVESTVLSQCNTWIILRLTNSNDQEHVRKFLPDNLNGLTKILPSLQRSEAIFIGEAAAIPSKIKINQLSDDKLPNSQDIKFTLGWKEDPIDEAKIEGIANRWIMA